MTADEWQALILQRRALATLSTPGTLSYTPAPPYPSGATIEAPWQTWQTDECNPDSAGTFDSMGAQSPAAAAAEDSANAGSEGSRWAIIAAVLGAAASLVYLKNSQRSGR